MAKKAMMKRTGKATGKGTATGPTGGSGAAFTDTGRVEELVRLMAENGLTEIELVEDKSRIMLRRGGVSGGGMAAAPMMSQGVAQGHTGQAGHGAAAEVAPKPDEALIPIKSPMVGTFYTAPNPESEAYVSIGTVVQKDKTVVAIIEAMKVFNEIHADASGTVVKLLVSNGQTVEFGQPLFMVKAE